MTSIQSRRSAGQRMQELRSLVDRVASDRIFGPPLDLIRTSTPKAYLVGGAVRDRLLEAPWPPRDIDILIDSRFQETVDALGAHFPIEVNRHGNYRVLLGTGASLDVFSPATFFCGFETPEATLAYFDLSINAVGLGLTNGSILDPVAGIADGLTRRATLIAPRWRHANRRESIHILLRLLKLQTRLEFIVVNPEVAIARLNEISRVKDWSEFEIYHGMSRSEALHQLVAHLNPTHLRSNRLGAHAATA